MSVPNTGRWAELSAKYKLARDKSSDEAFRVGRLAIHLKDAVARACGCSAEYVRHYSYEHGATPQYDESKPVSNGWRSVAREEAGWVFGLGVQLEVDANTHPKTMVVFPFTVVVSPDHFDVQTTLLAGSERIRAAPPQYAADVDALGERVFEGLSEALDKWAAGDARAGGIGFSST